MNTKIVNLISQLKNFSVSPFKIQVILEKLYYFSLDGMNYGNGGGKKEDNGELWTLKYIKNKLSEKSLFFAKRVIKYPFNRYRKFIGWKQTKYITSKILDSKKVGLNRQDKLLAGKLSDYLTILLSYKVTNLENKGYMVFADTYINTIFVKKDRWIRC